MDPQQPQQTSADPQVQAQVPVPIESNGAAQFDQNFIPQMSNPHLMTGLLPGQGYTADPNISALPMGDPSIMFPMAFANGQLPPQAQTKAISADEIALYDRQIRLWGMAAQAKIQNAHILLITMRALANEIAKNLVLAGVGSLTILDSAPVTEADLGAQFFQSDDADAGRSHVGQNRAEAAAPALRKLNPRVQVFVDADGVASKPPSYFSAYDVVIATDLDPNSFNLINTATRINGKAFYAAGTHGMYGFIFSDLIEHDYVIEREAANVATQPHQETRTRSIIDVQVKGASGGKTIESVTKRELYSTWFLASDMAPLPAEYTSSKRRLRAVSPALSCLRALWEFLQIQGGGLPATRDDLKLFTQLATQKHKALSLPSETLRPEFLRAFLQNLGSEIAPVAAILGGQLAQDVINVLGQKQQPIQNTLIFDGSTMEGIVYALHPEGNLGASLLSGIPSAGGAPHPGNGDLHGANGSAAASGMMMGMPMDMNGLATMSPNGFSLHPNGTGSFAQNGVGMEGLQQQQQQQQSQTQEAAQPPVPVQQPPTQQPVSAPEQPPQEPSASVTGQPEEGQDVVATQPGPEPPAPAAGP